MFIPVENYDSDVDLDFLETQDLNSPNLPDKIVEIAYSIGGIRRYNYIFKLRRREALGDTLQFSELYMQICAKFLFCIQQVLRRNLEIIRAKIDLETDEFEAYLQKADL